MNRRQFLRTCGASGICLLCGAVGMRPTDNAPATRPEAESPLAACGLDCRACPTRARGCGGCHGDDARLWSSDCVIRTCCIKENRLSNCSECDLFPCKRGIEFESDQWAHHRQAVSRLRRMHQERQAAATRPSTRPST